MEEKKHPISELMGVTMQKIREMVDANTIIGQPIQAEGMTLIPISRLTFGFASGGSDYASKNQKPEAANSFGGGSGAGVNSGLHGADVTAHHDGHETAAHLNAADKRNVSGLDHGIGGFNGTDKTLGFDHAQSIVFHVLLLVWAASAAML